MSRTEFTEVIEEDLNWLAKQPYTLERLHIASILKASIDLYYTPEGEYRFEKLRGA